MMRYHKLTPPPQSCQAGNASCQDRRMEQWRLLRTRGPLAESQWALPADQSVLIGRAPEKRIVLTNAALS